MAESPKSNRRDFLKGKSAYKAARSVLDDIVDSGEPGRSPVESASSGTLEYLVHFEKTAMACQWQVMLPAGKPTHGPSVALDALNLVDQWEQVLTVYRDDSNLSLLNVLARVSDADVDKELIDILEQSFELSRHTEGAFDVTAGPLSRLWGWYGGRPQIPDQQQVSDTLKNQVGFQNLRFDASQRKLGFEKSAMEINLGGIGKGYTLDQCAKHLVENEVDSFLMHSGRSSVVARGVPNRSSDAWKICLRHPIQRDVPIADIFLRNQALSTSGIQRQGFYSGGKLIGHILDPRTGHPPNHCVLSATVIAPSTAQADALSTAFFVMGPDKAEEYCKAHNEVGALMMIQKSRAEKVQMAIINLDESQYKLA